MWGSLDVHSLAHFLSSLYFLSCGELLWESQPWCSVYGAPPTISVVTLDLSLVL